MTISRKHSQYGVEERLRDLEDLPRDKTSQYQQTSFMSDPIKDFVTDVTTRGVLTTSRYGPCQEILGGRLEIPGGTLATRKGINYTLGWMELLQLVAGVYDIDALARVAPYADLSLFTPQMAYGPRIGLSIYSVIDALKNDGTTRQAVLFVGKAKDGPTSNLPCTLTIQFLIRETLIAVVSMRSWDLCRGLPYDIMMFSGLQQIVGRCLSIPAGNLIIQAGSAHVYLSQKDKTPRTSTRRWRFIDGAPKTWDNFRFWAEDEIRSIGRGGVPNFVECY